MIINIPEKIEYDINNREAYLQWKSDCWRNVAISLKESIENKNSDSIQNSLDMFETVKTMFPYVEI